MQGQYKIVDEESDNFGRVGTYTDTAVFNGRLSMYYIKFEDEELPYGFLAYQIEKVGE